MPTGTPNIIKNSSGFLSEGQWFATGSSTQTWMGLCTRVCMHHPGSELGKEVYHLFSMPPPTPVLEKVSTNSWACILFISLFKYFAFCKLSTKDDEVLNVLVLPDLFMLKLVGQRCWKAFGPLKEILFCKKQCLMLLVPLATSGYSVQVCFHFTIHPERRKIKI